MHMKLDFAIQEAVDVKAGSSEIINRLCEPSLIGRCRTQVFASS